jgi:molecular chaperone GrpE
MAVSLPTQETDMKFKNIFNNKAKMNTENNENEQELDEATLEANANGEQMIIEELTAEEKLAGDLEKEKDKFRGLFAYF